MASDLESDLFPPSKSKYKDETTATNWVRHVRKEAGLKKAFLFGTHNSGSGIGEGVPMNIGEQLNKGVRFLDLHLAVFEGDTWVYYDNIAYITFAQAVIEIETFLSDNEGEKLILYLRESPNAPTPVHWGNIKHFLKKGTHNSLVHKAQAIKPFSKMKGSIILIAPKALEMDGNWGHDAISHFETPAGVSTEEGLSEFLKEDSPSKEEPRPVWVEIKSLEDPGAREDKEISAVRSYFDLSCGKYNINIVSFSAVTEKHFKALKGTLA